MSESAAPEVEIAGADVSPDGGATEGGQHAAAPRGLGALQASAGNAAVTRVVESRLAGYALQRDPAPAPAAAPAQRAALAPADQKRLDTARTTVQTAKTLKDQALTALAAYSGGAPGKLNALKSGADQNVLKFKAAINTVNYVIAEAKETLKIQEEVFEMIVGALLGGVAGQVERIGGETKEAYDHLKETWDAAKEGAEELGIPDIIEKAKAGVGGEADPNQGAVADPSGKELEFYKAFAQLHANSTEMLGVGVTVGRLGEPIGRVDEAIAGIQNSGVLRSDYPIEMIERDANKLWHLSQGLTESSVRLNKLLADLDETLVQAQVSAPKDDVAYEKQVWKNWIAGLGQGQDFKLLDLDVIENHLERLGIWKELAIDRGAWFSDDEQILSVGSAKAIDMVSAKKESVVFEAAGGFATIQLSDIPGNPKIPARLDASSKIFTAKVNAVVIDAETIAPEGSLSTDILKQVEKTSDGSYKTSSIAEYLLRNGFIRAVLRSYSDASAPEGGGDGGAPPPP